MYEELKMLGVSDPPLHRSGGRSTTTIVRVSDTTGIWVRSLKDFETEEDGPTVDRRFRGFMINLDQKART